MTKLEEKTPELPTVEDIENPLLAKEVESDTEVKTWLVDYVGKKYKPEDEQVTVAMIVETLAEEFPDFLLVVAEENWLRGYRQGIHDVESGMRLAQQEGHEIPFLHPPEETAEEE
jgi:hypothetical protein